MHLNISIRSSPSAKGLGDINVSAIEDYKTVKERHEGLSVQYADLEKAKADLYTLIGQLTQTMAKVSEQTFKFATPKEGDKICVTGVFQTYKDGKDTYCTLTNARLVK